MWTGPAPYVPLRHEAVRMAGHVHDLALLRGLHHQLGRPSPGHRRLGLSRKSSKNRSKLEGTGVLPDGGMTDTWISWQMEMRYASGLKMSYCNTGNPYEAGLPIHRRQGLGPRQSQRHLGRAGVAADGETQAAATRSLHASPAYADPYTAHTADFFRSIRTRAGSGFAGRVGACRQHAGQCLRHRPATGTQAEVGPAAGQLRRR